MMWNNNDTKYIIKRLILYFLITGIVFFAGQHCAKAEVTTAYVDPLDNTTHYWSGTYWEKNISSSHIFANKGEGTVLFTVTVMGTHYVKSIELYQTAQAGYTCDVGSVQNYYDNTTQVVIYTATCPMNIGSTGIYKVRINGNTNGNTVFPTFSGFFTFVSKDSPPIDYSTAINGVISATNDSITAIGNLRNDTQAIQSDLNTNFNNQISAINTQTDAINNLNDNIMADYNGPSNSDIDAINSLDGIFTNEDQDVIRGILLFPTRLFIILASALDSNSCVTYSFGYLLGTEIYLPCLNYKNIIGTNLYTIIDIVFGLCVLYGLVRYIIHLYDFIFSVGLKGGVVVAAVEVFK